MNTNNNSHFLSLNHPIINTNGLEQLASMWSVISKCKDHLEEGTRLENMSWRLWHQKHQQHFVKPILSLSAGKPIHEVSQAKQTQNNHVPDKDGRSFSFIHVPSSLQQQQQQQQQQKQSTTTSTRAKTAGSANALVPSTATTTTTNSSRTTTPSLSNSYQYGDEENDDDDDDDDLFDEDYDDDFYDDDDLYDENDNYIIDEAEEAFMHDRHRTEKLRPYQVPPSQHHYFEKTLPRPLRQQPSLLSALFKTSPSSSNSSLTLPRSSFHPITTTSTTTFPSSSNTSRVPPPPDHFLKKEWTESLRDNVLWEHVQQQKPLYTRSHPSYYHHPPPSSTYQSPYHRHHKRPPFKKTMVSSDQGWLESFHGW